jgi:hypothetical protein
MTILAQIKFTTVQDHNKLVRTIRMILCANSLWIISSEYFVFFTFLCSQCSSMPQYIIFDTKVIDMINTFKQVMIITNNIALILVRLCIDALRV